MLFFNKKSSVLGVDIGTSDIKVAQVTHRRAAKPHLDTYGIVNLSYQLSNDSSSEAVSKAADVLKRLVEHAGVTTKNSIISLPNSAVFTTVIDMPVMSDKDMEQAVQYEAKKYLPLPVSEAILSWSATGSVSADKKTRSILLTAVPKHLRESYIALFDQAGLDLQVIEIEALALIRALVFDKTSSCAIIDIGAKMTGINFVRDGALQLSRSVNVGGDTIVQRIAQVLNISHGRAEQFHKDFGVAGSGFIPDAARPVLDSIRVEAQQLLKIYQAKGEAVDKVILAGGGAVIPGLVDFFSTLAVPVEVGDPLSAVDYPPEVAPVLKRYAMHLSVAIGLGLNADN